MRRAGHRREPRHRRRGGGRTRPAGRARGDHRAHPGRAGGNRRRDPRRPAAQATLLPLDLREADQIDAIGPTLYQRFGRLDVLVHNAGALGKLTPVSHILNDDWADVVGVNLNAALAADPHLRAAAAAGAGRPRGVRDRRQCAAAERLLGRDRCDQGGDGAPGPDLGARADAARRVRVNLFDPGRVRTRMRSNAFPGEDPRRCRCRRTSHRRWRACACRPMAQTGAG